MIETLGFMILGLVLLLGGAEVLVRGASQMAAAFRIPPLIIGLTVVAFGTSSPELAVSIQSSINGQNDIAVGNVVGSNIFNILFILGLSALITPLLVSTQLVRLDVPIVIAISLLMWLLSADNIISHWDGLLLTGGIIAYTAFLIIQGRKEESSNSQAAPEQNKSAPPQLANIALVIVGLGLLVLGSNWLVDGAVKIARALGISELIIGLTIISAGTSLPEIATSVMASIKGERDIAVGNVIGSCIFNILAVLGISSLFSAHGLSVASAALNFDIPVMVAVAIACLPIFFTGHTIARWEGAVFLFYYVAYVSYLIMNAMQHEMLGTFNATMLLFVIPLTLMTLLISALRAIAERRRKSGARQPAK